MTRCVVLGVLAALSAAPATLAAQGSTQAPTRLRFVVAPTGNEARYKVRERLVGRDLDNDVVGVTKDVAGRLLVESNGRVVRDSSRIIVQAGTFVTDQTRRDGYVRRRTLEVERFPTVELVPTTFAGISSPIPSGATRTFSLTGDLTIRGVTRPTTWQVTARGDGRDVVGTATTAFTYKDFGIEQPRVPIVLSVADTLRLEYDFRFTPAGK
mgnify:CR=1 FL=1